ncbi:MAG: NUDIX hydrolase [Bombilactobacillus mellifer]|uniref:NUDIX hydrolase n=1 Tax=Bombilactobacillus mellifer TaxID=1218492 RepID=UPI0023F0C807|nr:NUDIX hydrolase [Bombilactobacillus mellifer]MCT6843342.1 NUDIX hydrolase [Bombilactobacillus mellifer]
MEIKEKFLNKKRIYSGKIINLDVEQVQLPNQRVAHREVVHHHGAVGILAIVQQRLLLVEQWREPLRQLTLEIPAGKIDPGETDPHAVAIRELNEETGLQADKLIKWGGFFSTPGFSDEYLTLFYAPQVQAVSQKRPLDEDEFLNIKYLTWEQVQQQIQAGTICDAKTLLAVQIWQNHLLQGSRS